MGEEVKLGNHVAADTTDRALLDLNGPVPCASCGYDLRGRALDSACPECNAPVSAAIDPVRHALLNPAWIATLAKGANSWRWFGWPSLLILLAVLLFVRFGFGGSPRLMVTICVQTLIVLVGCVLLHGIWLITAPPPIRLFERRVDRCRIVARWSVPIVFVLGPALCVYLKWIVGSTRWATCCFWLFTPFGLVGVFAAVAFLVYFRRLAVMLGVEKARREAGIHLTVLPTAFALTAFGLLVATPRPWGSGFVACGLFAQVCAGVLTLLMPVTLSRRAAELMEAASAGVDAESS